MDLFTAISNGKVRHITQLLQESDGSLEARLYDGKTPLIYTVCDGNEDVRTHVVRMLLRKGADVNARDKSGRTALMYATMDVDKIDLVRVLSRCKLCDVNAQDKDGNTAIIHAVMCANSSAIRILVNATATKSSMDLELRNKHGLTALDAAVKLQMTECCRILVCEGGADKKRVSNQTGLKRLMEDENLLNRTNNPHSRNPSRTALVNRLLASPIPEDKQFEGSYMSRDTTPNYVDDFPERHTLLNNLSRSNSLHRSNSNLYKRRPEAGSRQSINSIGSDLFSILDSQKNLKRVLTPISGRHMNVTPETTEDKSMGRTRLPSIPSGRKLYLVQQNNKLDHL
ncbi:ankyrin repeat domain-containing protein 33B-like [Mya arenaria]|uniref:ankyrin repeat domain-containing protein 33B-like n=1 Tax=Mya arenaria TaxID=6604 RepID=UPI0022E7EA53|nr:ankyrin repeat domain-containing protein 33B-like [Mya arenaria]